MTLSKKTVWVADDGKEFTDRKAANAHSRIAELVEIVKTASSPDDAVAKILSGYRVMKNTGQKRPRKEKPAVAAVPESKPEHGKVKKVKEAA